MQNISLILIIIFIVILISTNLIFLFRLKRFKKNKKKFDECEDYFKNIFSQAPHGIEIYDKNENLISANKKCLEIFGVEKDEDVLEFNILKSTYLPKDISLIIQNDNFFKSEIEIDFDYLKKERLLKTKKNGICILILLIIPTKSENDITGYLVQINDITEERIKSKEIKIYTNQLEEINSNKDKFFSVIAHDLQSPFTVLLGLSQILSEDFDNLKDAEKRKFINEIQRTSKNLYSLINNLLQWSSMQIGKIQFRPIRIDLCDAVFRIIEMYSINAIAKNIKIINNINPDTFVFADQNMLHSIIQNIFLNAVKFTNTGGQITISSVASDDFITLNISDTGVGIPKERMNKLLKIDSHFSTEGTSGEKGTGLGLILCKEFIEKNGGKLYIESECNKGTSIKFSLPQPIKF